MKFYLKKALAVLTISVMLVSVFAGLTVSADNNVVARYLVTSDVHNLNGDLSAAIEATYNYAQTQSYKGFDAIAVAGDLTNYGKDDEFTAFRTAVDSTLDQYFDEGEAPQLVAIMGNHDYGNKSNSEEVNAAYRDSFERIIGCTPSDVYEINGVTFIGVSMPSHINENIDFAWLEEQLAAATAKNPNGIINILTHVPLTNTCFGSEDGLSYKSRLRGILEQYPNAILWAGHTHAYIGNERSLYQNESGFSAINTGSFSTASTYYDTSVVSGTVGSEQVKAFYIVEAFANGDSKVRRYDLKNGKFFDTDWYIGDDYDNSLAGRAAATEAPYFAEGSALTIGGGTEGTLIYLPDAADDESVEFYKTTVTDGENTIENTTMRHYYYSVVNPVQIIGIKGLKANTTYTATVKAVDFFGKESETLTATFTTGEYGDTLDTLYEGAIDADEWTGSTDRITEVGFGADHSGNSHTITLKNKIDLGNAFEVAVDFTRNETNLYDYNYSLIQIGELSVAFRRTGASNTIALCYGYNAGMSDSPIDSKYVVKQIHAPNTIDKEEYRIVFDNGNVLVYRSGAVVISVTAEELAAFIGGDYDFSGAAVSLKLSEKWIISVNSARFETFTLKAIIPNTASYTFIENPLDTENWVVNAENGNVTDGRLNIGSVGSSSNIYAKEKVDLGSNFAVSFKHLRKKYNPNANNFSFAQFGDLGVLIQNNYSTGESYLSLCYGFDAVANGKTAPTAEQILATSANLGAPDAVHSITLEYNNGLVKVIRDGSVAITYDATALDLDFSQTQVAFQMYETWVTTNNGYSFIEGYTATRTFSVDELVAAIDALIVDGKLVGSDEAVDEAVDMYSALADYQTALVTNADKLALAIKLRDRVAGDVNGDQYITTSDYNAVVLSLLGYNNEYDADNLDVNLDGSVTSADSLALMQHMLGIASLY